MSDFPAARRASAWLRALTRLLALALAVGVAAGMVATSHAALAQGVSQAEYRVKAAFLYKFPSFIEWPDQAFPRPDSPIVVGVAGADSVADELAQITAGRNVNGRPIVVRKLRRQDTVAGVHMLFIGRGEGARAADLLAAVKGQAILTVTEQDEARSRGGSINFVLVDDKVRFDVDLEPAEQGGIRISSRLLTVARRVASKSS